MFILNDFSADGAKGKVDAELIEEADIDAIEATEEVVVYSDTASNVDTASY